VFDIEMQIKKGHHYIVPTSGSPEPTKDMQAVPHFGALTSMRPLAFQTGDLK
jgi:hypothetical protein